MKTKIDVDKLVHYLNKVVATADDWDAGCISKEVLEIVSALEKAQTYNLTIDAKESIDKLKASGGALSSFTYPIDPQKVS